LTGDGDLATNVIAASPRKIHVAYVLVLVATIIWGSQYIVIKFGLATIPPFFFQGMRHVFAFLGYAPFYGRLRKLNKYTLVASLVMAIFLYLMVALLSYGLEITTSNKAAFMATMYVVFTPFLAFAVLKSRVKKQHLGGVGVAVAGLGVMLFANTGSSADLLAFNVGDALILIGAVFNAMQIVLLEKYSNKVDIVLFSMMQIGILASLQLGTSFAIQEQVAWSAINTIVIANWIYMGIVNSAATMLIQAWAQKFIDANKAALLYSVEPVFAIFFGISLGGEPLTIAFVAGAILILTGILLTSLKINRNKHLAAIHHATAPLE
jgi:drug/metabolite transporter (DMT)-like permease